MDDRCYMNEIGLIYKYLNEQLTRVKLRGFIEIDVFAFQLRMTTTVKD